MRKSSPAMVRVVSSGAALAQGNADQDKPRMRRRANRLNFMGKEFGDGSVSYGAGAGVPIADSLDEAGLSPGTDGDGKLGRGLESEGAGGAGLVEYHRFREVLEHRQTAAADDARTGGPAFDRPAGITGKDWVGGAETAFGQAQLGITVQFVGIKALGVVVFMKTYRKAGGQAGHGLAPSRDVRVAGMVKEPVEIIAFAVATDIEGKAGRIEQGNQDNIGPPQISDGAFGPFQQAHYRPGLVTMDAGAEIERPGGAAPRRQEIDRKATCFMNHAEPEPRGTGHGTPPLEKIGHIVGPVPELPCPIHLRQPGKRRRRGRR